MQDTTPLRFLPLAGAALVLLLAAASAPASECVVDLGPPVVADEATSGALLLATDASGLYVSAPTVHTDVDLVVTGIVARGTVVQRFRNPTMLRVEGLYVFPLPENAAVDALRMVIGERVVEGRIEERAQARRTYDAAKSAGRRASLVSQHRPNLFTTRLANIGPGEEIRIEIGYLQSLRVVDGSYRLRFPTVVAPRFGPVCDTNPAAAAASDGLARVLLPCDDVVPVVRREPRGEAADAGEERGDAADAAEPGKVSLTVRLDLGGPLAAIDSPFHDVAIALEDGYRYRVSLRQPQRADRDFELVWEPALGELPTARAFVEERDGEFFTLVVIHPPTAVSAERLSLPKETIFVIDTSGSMHGASLAQARRAVLTALGRLRPEDSFNVIRFASEAETLFPQAVPVGRYSLDEAREWVERLQANGGTHVAAALDAALADQATRYPVRQVILVTDGAVGNEAELFAQIRRQLGDTRLFAVGIGSAPNSFLLRQAAKLGRGTFTYIGSVEQVGARMGELFAQLESPVLTDLVADWGDPLAQTYPERLPDLYAGEPLIVVSRSSSPVEGVSLSGARGALRWNESLTVPPARRRRGIAKLWARARLDDLADRIALSDDREPLEREALDTALAYHLVSPYTSLVAVDSEPVGPAGQPPVTRAIPLHLPAGWTHPGWVGELPATGTPARALGALGLAALLLAGFVHHRPRRGDRGAT
jgi:Ca-activated chloride channel family protein